MNKYIKHILTGSFLVLFFIRPYLQVNRFPLSTDKYLDEFINIRIHPYLIPALTKHWKCYSDACVLGDFIVLDEPGDYVRNDTLFINDTPKAVIIKYYLRSYSFDFFMTLQRIPDGEEGEYIS